MSTNINKICLFAGNFVPQGWASCNGQNDTPKVPNLVFNTFKDWHGQMHDATMPYICCKNSNEDAAESFMGQVMAFSGNFVPMGWHKCDGTLFIIDDNGALFSILNTTYGGDGTTTFSLPNMKDIYTSNNQAIKYIICIEGRFPSRP